MSEEAGASGAGMVELREDVAELREQVAELAALVRRDVQRRPELDEVDEELADAVAVLAAAHEAERHQLTGEQAAAVRKRVEQLQTQLAKGRGRGPGESYVNLTPKHVQPKWTTVEAAQRLLEADLLKLERAERSDGPGKTEIAEARARIGAVAAQRLTDAVTGGQPLPVWLSAAVGSMPRPDPEPWLSTARRVLTFRLEHGVTDAILPLGAKPGGEDAYSARRAGEFAKIAEQLNQLHKLGGASEFAL